MHEHSGELAVIAQERFAVMRACGENVRELLHDRHPTACVADAAFGPVNAFKALMSDSSGFVGGGVKTILPLTGSLLRAQGKFC